MQICVKVIPELYKYLKFTQNGSFVRKPINIKYTTLIYDRDCFQKLIPTSEEINKAYRIYAQSPFVNSLMRSGEPMSEQSNHIVECLRTAIQKSEGATGKFFRGLTGTRKKAINEETIGDFIFNNKAFTSTAPEGEASFAKSFALGSNSAVVEFDITKPIKAFQPNRYETIFDSNAFTRDSFGIEKIEDGYYRVFQK